MVPSKAVRTFLHPLVKRSLIMLLSSISLASWYNTGTTSKRWRLVPSKLSQPMSGPKHSTRFLEIDKPRPVTFAPRGDRFLTVDHLRLDSDNGKAVFLEQNQDLWECCTLTAGVDPPVWSKEIGEDELDSLKLVTGLRRTGPRVYLAANHKRSINLLNEHKKDAFCVQEEEPMKK